MKKAYSEYLKRTFKRSKDRLLIARCLLEALVGQEHEGIKERDLFHRIYNIYYEKTHGESFIIDGKDQLNLRAVIGKLEENGVLSIKNGYYTLNEKSLIN